MSWTAAGSAIGDNLQPLAGSGNVGEVTGWHTLGLALVSTVTWGVPCSVCLGRKYIKIGWDVQEAPGGWAQAEVG